MFNQLLTKKKPGVTMNRIWCFKTAASPCSLINNNFHVDYTT